MHSFATTITAATACFAALTAAVPHARKHFQLHPARDADLEPRVVKLAPLAGREVPAKVNLLTGQCGGDTGYGCGPGFCCSKWGYCGTTAEYCEGGDAPPYNMTVPAGNHGRPGHQGRPGRPGRPHGRPHSRPPPVPTTYPAAPTSEAPASSSEAPAPSSEAPAPSSAAPAPSEAPSAAPSAPAYSSAAPQPSGGAGSGFSGYKMYSGDGSSSAGWPSIDQWMDFESAWTASVPNMQASCAQFDQEDDTQEEIAAMKSAIQSNAAASGVDERFVLAVMMQESNGCVRVWTTDNGVTNPGLFQSHNGGGSCFNQVPCPASEINLMVKNGVQGTKDGDGLQQTLDQCSTSGAQAYYQAAVIYNSGNLPASLDDNTATPCYASDLANRLMGWTEGATECTL